MLRAVVSLLLLLSQAVAMPAPQDLVDIVDAVVDANGDGVVDRIGETVRVRGAVIATPFPAFVGDDREYRFYLQDDTAGIRVVSPKEPRKLEMTTGIAVEVSGSIGQYNGMPTLRLHEIVDFGPAETVEPAEVSFADFDGERLCGSLVRMVGPIYYDDKRYFLGRGPNRIRLFLRPSKEYVPFIDVIQDGFQVEVSGVVEQFTKGDLFQGGYRIRPRQLSEVSVVVPFLARPETRVAGLVALGLLATLLGWLALRWRRAKSELESPQVQRMHSLGTMAGGVAHEFNNYLLAIVGFAELARSELPEGAPANEHLDEVLAAGGRAKALIEQILTYSRAKEGAMVTVDALDAVREGLRLVRAVMPATVEVVERLEPDVGELLADRGQLSQVMLNLGTNASKAMPQGGTFTVTLRRVEVAETDRRSLHLAESGPHLQLEVSDTGVGMPAEVRLQVFDPFFTTHERAEGTGLGLSVVQGIVKRHRGAIDVESEVGVGTTFRLYLPLIESGEVTLQPKPPVETAPRSVAAHSGCVLLVDDQQSLTRLVEKLFRRMGFEVVTAHDGLAAYAEVKRAPQRFDLIVSDLTMPRMTGVELARRVRELGQGVPFLIMTGNASSLDRTELEGAGVQGVLTKPFSSTELESEVARLLGESDPAEV